MTVQTLGDGMFDAKPRPRFAWQWQPLVPIGIAAFSLSSLISYHVRQPEVHSALQAVVSGIYRAIGFVPACMFFILVLAWSSIWFVRGELVRPGARLLRLLGFTLATAMLVNLRSDDGLPPPLHAGVIGHWLSTRLMHVFGYVLSILMVAPAFFVTCVLATDWFFARFFDDLLTSGPRGTGGDRLGGEVGVEDAATEHLKSLALAGLQPQAPAPTPWMASAVLDPVAAFEAAEEAAELDAMASAIAETAEESDAQEPLRLTAYERRRLAAEQLAAAIERASLEAEAEDEAEAAAEANAEAEERAFAATETAVDLTAFAGASEAAGLRDDEADAVAEADEDDEAVEANVKADAPVGTDVVVDEDVEVEADIEASDSELEASDVIDAVVSVPTVPKRSVPDPGLGGPESATADADASESDAFALDEAEVDEDEIEDEIEGDADADDRDTEAESEDFAAPSHPAEPAAAEDREPAITIPRPTEGVRQRRLFADAAIDDNLLREAEQLILDSRRASATMLQRKLRIDYEQAMNVLTTLAQRGVIEMQEGESTGRVVN